MTATLRRPPAFPRPTGAGPPGPPAADAARRQPGADGVLANVVATALTLAAVIALSRLFTDSGRFFVPVAVVALVTHLVSWACRRARLPVLPSAIAVVVVAIVTACIGALGQTTAYGLPWLGTWHALGPALQAAASTYRTAVAPTPVLPGFILAAGFGVASAGFLTDWAAFRMRTTVEACLPSFSLFVLASTLAQGHGITLAAGVWLAALLAFLLARQPAVEGTTTAWFASRRRGGAEHVLTAGVIVAVVAVAATVIIGPHLPGATSNPLINWRHNNGGTRGRDTASPLVDIKDRLLDQSTAEVFTVSASQPSYWRLTALDNFNGTGWSLNDNYTGTGASLATTGANTLADAGPSSPVQASFSVTGLSSLWLPAAYRPVHITGPKGLSFSSASASIISKKDTSNGLTYSVVSDVPAVSPAELRAATRANPVDPSIAPYVQLPATLPAQVNQLAIAHTQGATTPYDEALDLQNWLRTPPFRYDLNVPADDSASALVDFLTISQAGFCQQYAAAFAALARSIGLPTRVAVGFTEGDLGADGLYHVRDDDAHAWPEVYFTGIGWIAFEPTPGRGSPDPRAQAITGVPPGQAPPPGGGSSATTAPPTTTAGSAATVPVPNTVPKRSPVAKHKAHHSSPLRVLLEVLAAILVALVGWVGLLAGANEVLRARRRGRARSPDARVGLAWQTAGEALAAAGTPLRQGETPAEFSRRVGAIITMPPVVTRAVTSLASTVEVAAYSPAGPVDDDVTGAEAAARTVANSLAVRRSARRRILDRLDPRPIVQLAADVKGSRVSRSRSAAVAAGPPPGPA